MAVRPYAIPKVRIPVEVDWERAYWEKAKNVFKATYHTVKDRAWDHPWGWRVALLYGGALEWGLIDYGMDPIVAILSSLTAMPFHSIMARTLAFKEAALAVLPALREWHTARTEKASLFIPEVVDKSKLKAVDEWWRELERRERALIEERRKGYNEETWEWKGYRITRDLSTFESKVGLYVKEGEEVLLRLPYLPAGERIYIATIQGVKPKVKGEISDEELLQLREKKAKSIKRALRKLKHILQWVEEVWEREVWMISPEANFYSSPFHVGRPNPLPFSLYSNIFDAQREEVVLLNGRPTTARGEMYLTHFSAVMPFLDVPAGEYGRKEEFYLSSARPLKR